MKEISLDKYPCTDCGEWEPGCGQFSCTKLSAYDRAKREETRVKKAENNEEQS